MPTAELFVHSQGCLEESDLEWLSGRLNRVLEEVMRSHPGSDLEALEELELSLVDDATLAEVHGEFLDDPTLTDVITFPHGELLVSVEMAEKRAEEYGKGVRGEVFLYIIHGLLHLAGYDDHEEQEATAMAVEQERIWAKYS